MSNININQPNTIIPWYEAFGYVVEGLELFRKTFPKHTEKELFHLFNESEEFKTKNSWLNKLGNLKKRFLDPIHIFASLNNSKSSYEQRTELVKTTLLLLRQPIRFEKIDFSGCPAPIIVSIVSPRELREVEQIWKLFDQLRLLKKAALTNALFAQIKSWNGVGIASFTIFLFWVDSLNFLSLDKNTVSLLHLYHKFSDDNFTREKYLDILENKETNLYRNLVRLAIDSKFIDKLSDEDRFDLEQYLNISFTKSGKEVIDARSDFKIIAIRPLKGCSVKFRKVLEANKYYYFYSDYVIRKSSVENTSQNVVPSIYNVNDIKVNISAIAGKNGTGKSSISELLIVILNNLAIRFLPGQYSSEFVYVPEIAVELFFKTDSVYKIILDRNTLEVYKYMSQDENLYTRPRKQNHFELNDFFYSVFINYSQFALNENNVGHWLRSLFIKNDAYQTPIVLEPKRLNGNIDVNNQQKLLASRLLSNLLQPDISNDDFSFRQITPTLRAEKLIFNLDESKVSYLFRRKENDAVPFEALEDCESCLDILFRKFGIKGVSAKIKDRQLVISIAKRYILKKLVSIARNYSQYKHYFDEQKVKLTDFAEFLSELKANRSHITYKLWQAIYFIKFRFVKCNTGYTVEELSFAIEKIKFSSRAEKFLTTELIPPPFLTYNLFLTRRISFESLSSGEKQRIYSVQSILYHIKNIDSVADQEGLIRYNRIAVMLDEIELYFHPDYQRIFIAHLLDALRRIDLYRISGIQISFVTHSPFILSDIPRQNILFLRSKEDVELTSNLKTFGANIHELLVNGFFMDHTLGEYALKKINQIVDFHKKVSLAKLSELDDLKFQYEQHRNTFSFIIDNLGEEYIRKVLENHIEEIEAKLSDKRFIQNKIRLLKSEIDNLNRKL
ncbi:AAA family ATPase [Terrimonas sp. NA20]|uniref:AAA family ATPase n=1 Tax=Terrimonas ginsenosidimutans TaxID=2908004 RepID=A0ABS9KKC4_9BACT|nr:AAA family ATPase [Terrimonas ginsenosidimutans]MCG2612771.1 AAA family ATPase [Terrimonas ginsenosidimutans]